MKKKAASGRMTLQVDLETHKALQSYSELTDIPIGRIVARAVQEWMNTKGKVHLEVMQGQAGQVLLSVSDGIPEATANIAPGDNRWAAH